MDLLALKESEMRRIRGNDISMIFQEPMTSLNPVFRVGEQIAEVFRITPKHANHDAEDAAIDMLRKVGIRLRKNGCETIPTNERRHASACGYAMALACDPKLMLADEPTTALDVTIHAQILELMNDIKGNKGTGIILITHDLGVVAEMADRVAVMYRG